MRIENVNILLGADLEETPQSDTGWTAILDSASRPSGRAGVFKIPHHGSGAADQPRVWSEMLIPDPVAVLTPWSRGRRLPTDRDRDRICTKSSRVFTTATQPRPGQIRRPQAVERAIRDSVKYLHRAIPPSGQVTARRGLNAGSRWAISLVGPAGPLCPDRSNDTERHFGAIDSEDQFL